MGVGESVLGRIGNTPLVRLARIGSEFPGVQICAKAEWFNPGGSVKDRAALSMIEAGIASGALRAGKTIIDATSGNTGNCLRDDWRGAGVSGEVVSAG